MRRYFEEEERMVHQGIIKRLCVFLFFVFGWVVFAQAQPVCTPVEKSDYKQYSQNEDIALFLSELSHLSEVLKVKIIGQSLGTRQYESEELFLSIVTEDGIDSSEDLDRVKPTLLLVASQHGNEQSAKEAALWFLRDLCVGELKPLLQQLNILVIAQANPYGNRFDQRQNEQDLDLNRDHVKLEAPEVIAIHHVFREWMPEVTLDVHEKGDDFYRVSIGCVSNVNIHPRIQDYSRNVILDDVEKALQKKRITFYEYLVSQRMGIDSSAGVTYRPEDQGRGEMMMRYSTTDLNDGRNSLGIYETFSFIQEGASRHDIASLEDRTNWQYLGIRYFAESAARHGEEILSLVNTLRRELETKARFYSADDLVYLRMKYTQDENQPTLTIQRFERSASPLRGVLRVDKKAGDPLTAADIAPYPYPAEYRVGEESVKNWYPRVEPTVSVSRPLGYIIPAGHSDLIKNLLNHSIAVDIFAQDQFVDVEVYQVADIIPAEYDYLPPQKIEVIKKSLEAIVKKGDFYVSCAQPAANLIPCLLEPESQYGLIRYWTFNLVPEKGDIFPIYRTLLAEKIPLFPFQNWRRK